MTLEQAIAHGRAHQPRARAARARLDAARVEAATPAAQWRPSLAAFAELVGSTVNNSTATVINQPSVDLPRIGATPLRSSPSFVPYATSAAAVGGRQLLLDFGRVRAQLDAGQAAVRQEEARLEGAEMDLDATVALAFYDVLAAKASAGVAERAFARARARREWVEASAGVGMRPPSDRTRADADAARYEAVRLRADGALSVARMRLAATVGAAAIEVDAAAPTTSDPIDARGLEALVAERDPQVRGAREAVASQEGATRALAAQGRPLLFATGAFSVRGGGAQPSSGSPTPAWGFLPVVPNFDVGLVLSIPLFDPALSARVEASRAREAALRHELEATRLERVAAARQVLRGNQAALASLSALERAVAAAAVNAEQAEARLRAGLGAVNEVADAEALRVEAELQLVLGKLEAQRARVVLKRSLSDKESSW